MKIKVVTKLQLKNAVDNLKRAGKKIVFTNGCFELIHRGHVEYLEKAKKLGDVLIVAVNSDSSVRKLKGKKRPIVPEDDRIKVVSALETVDFVLKFNEDTPEETIKYLKPDILVKGGDYKIKKIAGRDSVIGGGGKVIRIPLVKNKSTTNLIRRICRVYTE